MVRHTDAADATEYVNDQIDRAVELHDVDPAEVDGAAVIGQGDDAYVVAKITFNPLTTVRDVARVRRSLPMSFDRDIGFRHGDTLTLRVRAE